jgi:hypothetical protein
MGIGRGSEAFSDSFGEMTRHVLGLDFRVGPDNPLIRLHKLVDQKYRSGRVSIEDLNVDEILSTGAFGRTHVVDVSAEDPEYFFFKSYAPQIRIALNEDMTGRRLASSTWNALRRFGMTDYQRLKVAALPELSQVDLKAGTVSSVNRRFVAPFFGDRGKVTHLLVSIVPDQQHVFPHSLQ